jgi:phenylacetate-CoA ligase
MRSLVKNIFHPLVTTYDGFPGLNRQLVDLEKSQYYSVEAIREIQFRRLKKLIEHAYQNVPFYTKRFDQYNFKPEMLKDTSDLKLIPTLTKKDILENGELLIARNIPKREMHRSSSGGTTGVMTWFYRDNRSLVPKEASQLRFEKWTGWDIGEWMSIIWPAVIDSHPTNWKSKLKNQLAYRKNTLDFAVINTDAINDHLLLMKKTKTTMIRAFPIPMVEVARYVLAHQPDRFQVKGVITTGEPLYESQRNLIEKAFQCKVYDSYRTREIGAIAQECEEHDGLHINSESVYLETVADQKDQIDNKQNGKLLVTDLFNYASPFIRYEIGDVGSFAEKSCSCGRGLPLLQDIGGRLVDVLYTTDGRKIATITVMPNLIQLLGITNQVQFEQHSLDRLTIRMSEPRPGSEIIEKQCKIAQKLFGENMRISYEFVDNIPLLPSGKYRLVISHVEDKEKVEK